MTTANVVLVAVALVSTACGARALGPPEIVVDRSTCSHCGMFVSEPSFAAAYHVDGQVPRIFDDIGCMLDALGRETTAPINVWLQDAAGRGWLDAGEAAFVVTANVRTPMNGGVLAYADAAAAAQAASAHRGEVVRSFQQLMTRKGDSR
jgi:nitrous oxide reductase accessory protein NosL